MPHRWMFGVLKCFNQLFFFFFLPIHHPSMPGHFLDHKVMRSNDVISREHFSPPTLQMLQPNPIMLQINPISHLRRLRTAKQSILQFPVKRNKSIAWTLKLRFHQFLCKLSVLPVVDSIKHQCPTTPKTLSHFHHIMQLLNHLHPHMLRFDFVTRATRFDTHTQHHKHSLHVSQFVCLLFTFCVITSRRQTHTPLLLLIFILRNICNICYVIIFSVLRHNLTQDHYAIITFASQFHATSTHH